MCAPAILALTRRYHRIFSGTIIARTFSDPERTVTRVCPYCKLAFRRFRSGLLAAISGEPNPDRILHITQSFCRSLKIRAVFVLCACLSALLSHHTTHRFVALESTSMRERYIITGLTISGHFLNLPPYISLSTLRSKICEPLIIWRSWEPRLVETNTGQSAALRYPEPSSRSKIVNSQSYATSYLV